MNDLRILPNSPAPVAANVSPVTAPITNADPVSLPEDSRSTPGTRARDGRSINDVLGSLSEAKDAVKQIADAHGGLDPARVARLLDTDE